MKSKRLLSSYLIIGLLLQSVSSGVSIARCCSIEHAKANAEVGEDDDGHGHAKGDEEGG